MGATLYRSTVFSLFTDCPFRGLNSLFPILPRFRRPEPISRFQSNRCHIFYSVVCPGSINAIETSKRFPLFLLDQDCLQFVCETNTGRCLSDAIISNNLGRFLLYYTTWSWGHTSTPEVGDHIFHTVSSP